jgi:methylglutamate dehydrogenase subunit D
MPDFALDARSPLAITAGRYGRDAPTAGLRLEMFKPRAMVQVMARRNRHVELAGFVQGRFGVALPDAPRLVRGDRVSFLWAGYLQWLALAAEEALPNLRAELHSVVGNSASLSDQSDARFAVVMSGPKARDTLAKLTPIDLHPRVFVLSQTALTLFGRLIGQITLIDEMPSYEVMVFRGFAESLWRALLAAGAEFGVDVVETST